MKKPVFSTELAYVLGLILMAIATAMMEAANFGMSMVVAPAYLLHLHFSKTFPFFSFGMAEYMLQAVLLIVMMLILRRFRWGYLFSFVTAVLYGFTLDAAIVLLAPFVNGSMVQRVVFYVLGMVICSLGVSLFFHTYLSPEAYELFVKEVSSRCGMEIHRFKTIYDCVSCLVAIALSFLFFGLWRFEGVKWGTVVCALINGKLIGLFSHAMEKHFTFADSLKLRPIFEK